MNQECIICGCTLAEATEDGKYFARANPKGVMPAEWRCAPSCAPIYREQSKPQPEPTKH